MKKIITVHEHPPIPVRDHDWLAFYDEPANDEQIHEYGNGRTEDEAIGSLLFNYPEEISEDENDN